METVKSFATERLPDFLIIGAMKAGTTSLYHDLRSLDQAFLPTVKEPACLVDDRVLTAQGRRRYASHYDQCASHQRAGDASTNYSKLPDFPGVPGRAEKVLGSNIRILYLVRDPVQRLVSQFRHEYSRGLMPADIVEAIDRYPRLVSYSRYRLQLEPWLDQFGGENVKVISFARYVSNRQETLNDIASFIGITHQMVEDSAAYNMAGHRLSSSPMGKLASSVTYKQRIRPLIPAAIRKRARKRATLDLPEPTSVLDPSVEKELMHQFQADIDWLKTLGVDLSRPSESEPEV